ncbi:hypothetical protein [Bradyrhizobium cajani]|uniref:DUF4398 domain-containing protein n=1 Tax=Bradyrhizobium cajani TaxID=1928661 RepID=A0A844T0S7_9BRAD|nr:hypothetical protein [Bradyrhizobium cajani]MCP3368057.1 hypothetical protein [Bradyrhizobium cajani]MVT71886.1 hypothetical protein [Bradyrhizobium cajani]
MNVSRAKLYALCLVVGWAAAASGEAAAASDEPTWEDCKVAVAEARALSAELPPDNLSRYFAERHLHQALAEAGNGEFDECLDMAARATQQVRERRHDLPPGERLRVLKADE